VLDDADLSGTKLEYAKLRYARLNHDPATLTALLTGADVTGTALVKSEQTNRPLKSSRP